MRMLRLKQQRHVWAALDIGSSKVCCMIAQYSEQGQMEVLGYGQHMSYGLKQGTIVNLDGLQQAIIQAVSQAEKMAGQMVDKLCVNLSSGLPQCRRQTAEIALEGQMVSDAHLAHLQDMALQQAQQPERLVLHMLPLGYQLDGVSGIQDPHGMSGQVLQVQSQIVDIVPTYVKNIIACLQQCRLSPRMVVLSPIAAAMSCLVPDEETLGSLVIDLGADVTGLCLIQDGQVQYADLIPIGAQAITQDIARGVGTTLSAAERIKNLYGSAVISADDQAVIAVPRLGAEEQAHERYLSPAQLTEIISARAAEIFELIRDRLAEKQIDHLGLQSIVLTGGGAQLQSIADLCHKILQKEARIAGPRFENMSHLPQIQTQSDADMTALSAEEAAVFPDFLKSGQWSGCVGLLKYARKFGGNLAPATRKHKKNKEALSASPAAMMPAKAASPMAAEGGNPPQQGTLPAESPVTFSPERQNIVTRIGGWLKQNF